MDRFQAITVHFCWVSLALLCFGRLTAAGDPTFRVPDGFEATLWADDDLATNIYAMTTDSRGRIVVSGPGYIKTLIDTDADGRADRAELFTDQIRQVPATLTDPAGPFPWSLEPDAPVLKWQNFLKNYRPPRIEPVALGPDRTLALPLLSIALALFAIGAGGLALRPRRATGIDQINNPAPIARSIRSMPRVPRCRSA